MTVDESTGCVTTHKITIGALLYLTNAMQLLYSVMVGGQELKNRMVLAPLTRARYVALAYWWDARRDDFGFLRFYSWTMSWTCGLKMHSK
jgi:hypothetical protein